LCDGDDDDDDDDGCNDSDSGERSDERYDHDGRDECYDCRDDRYVMIE